MCLIISPKSQTAGLSYGRATVATRHCIQYWCWMLSVRPLDVQWSRYYWLRSQGFLSRRSETLVWSCDRDMWESHRWGATFRKSMLRSSANNLMLTPRSPKDLKYLSSTPGAIRSAPRLAEVLADIQETRFDLQDLSVQLPLSRVVLSADSALPLVWDLLWLISRWLLFRRYETRLHVCLRWCHKSSSLLMFYVFLPSLQSFHIVESDVHILYTKRE